MSTKKTNNTKIDKNDHWIYIDDDEDLDLGFLAKCNMSTRIGQVLYAYQIKECGIFANHTLLRKRYIWRASRIPRIRRKIEKLGIDLSIPTDRLPIFNHTPSEVR